MPSAGRQRAEDALAQRPDRQADQPADQGEGELLKDLLDKGATEVHDLIVDGRYEKTSER
jgi:hypothetical protein